MDVAYDWNRLEFPRNAKAQNAECGVPAIAGSGVWRFRSLLPFAPLDHTVTIGEGQTILRRADAVGEFAGMHPGRLYLQYEGLNPSGSFKDNGMAAAFTHARMVGARRAACASTGNTSASLALYCAATGWMNAVVFIGRGKIAHGKLAQALDHGALTLQVDGDFDDVMCRVRSAARELGLYVVNSLNPFRLEGQKTIIYRVLQALEWEAPDWIVVPGGNLGNVSAFGKALGELLDLQIIRSAPRLAVINATGASTFYELFERRGVRWNDGHFDRQAIDQYYHQLDADGVKATTIASAIEINRPVNLPKALRALAVCGGVVRAVTDEEILDAKAMIGAGGFGCEPASAASVAGLRRLRQEGVIAASDRVVCILTGHSLKDPAVTVAYHGGGAKPGGRFSNLPVPVQNNDEDIVRAISVHNTEA
jgi:threonine synthase